MKVELHVDKDFPECPQYRIMCESPSLAGCRDMFLEKSAVDSKIYSCSMKMMLLLILWHLSGFVGAAWTIAAALLIFLIILDAYNFIGLIKFAASINRMRVEQSNKPIQRQREEMWEFEIEKLKMIKALRGDGPIPTDEEKRRILDDIKNQ
jgi:hypothetical protein